MSVDIEVVSPDEKMEKDILKLKDCIVYIYYLFLKTMVISYYKDQYGNNVPFNVSHMGHIK